LKPGQAVTLHARLFDSKGRFLREATGATWAVTGLKGTVNKVEHWEGGSMLPNKSAGRALSGEACAKVAHPCPGPNR
jgi:hypothetical protein